MTNSDISSNRLHRRETAGIMVDVAGAIVYNKLLTVDSNVTVLGHRIANFNYVSISRPSGA